MRVNRNPPVAARSQSCGTGPRWPNRRLLRAFSGTYASGCLGRTIGANRLAFTVIERARMSAACRAATGEAFCGSGSAEKTAFAAGIASDIRCPIR